MSLITKATAATSTATKLWPYSIITFLHTELDITFCSNFLLIILALFHNTLNLFSILQPISHWLSVANRYNIVIYMTKLIYGYFYDKTYIPLFLWKTFRLDPFLVQPVPICITSIYNDTVKVSNQRQFHMFRIEEGSIFL